MPLGCGSDDEGPSEPEAHGHCGSPIANTCACANPNTASCFSSCAQVGPQKSCGNGESSSGTAKSASDASLRSHGCQNGPCAENGGCSQGSVDGESARRSRQVVKEGFCVKCQENAVEAVANQREAMCRGCLCSALLQKFKTAINKHAMIARWDRVLLAFSGGHASRVALDFLHAIRSLAVTDAAAAADRGKTAFQLGVVYVDESAVLEDERSNTSHQPDLIALQHVVQEVGYHLQIAELEDLFADSGGQVTEPVGDSKVGGGGQGDRQALKALLAAVKDATGREDLVQQLRWELLQQIAASAGYTKVVRGDCATHLAVRALASVTKGRGYSVPGEVQHVDARSRVPVLLPLRDCVAKELALHCRLAGLRCVFPPGLGTGPAARPSINKLTDAFVHMLDEDLPGRVHTILKTVSKLQHFSFNTLSPAQVVAGSRKPRRPAPVGEDNSAPVEPLCALCQSPLLHKERLAAPHNSSESSSQDLLGDRAGSVASTGDCIGLGPVGVAQDRGGSGGGVCFSCRSQILGGDAGGAVAERLPAAVQARLRREAQRKLVANFLLDDKG